MEILQVIFIAYFHNKIWKNDDPRRHFALLRGLFISVLSQS